MTDLRPARQLTAGEIDLLEWVLGGVEAKRLVGEPLTPEEADLSDSLAALTDAEQDARAAFTAFHATLAADAGGPAGDAPTPAQSALPPDVAARIAAWMRARQAWDDAAGAALASIAGQPAPPHPAAPTPVRTGPRLRAALPEFLRVPTARPAHDALSLLFAPQRWRPDAAGGALLAEQGQTHVRFECDDALGIGPEQAVGLIARHGASVVQTFFALVGLWLERNPGATDHEAYLTVAASDLLRYQHRRQTPHGGYHRADQAAKGRDVYLLSRISVPAATVLAFDGGRREARTLSLSRLLSVEALEVAEGGAGEGSAGGQPVFVRFRYHLGREVWDWVGGGVTGGGTGGAPSPQYAVVSGKLLSYHPVREKYQILLGFCLAYYDRVNRKNRSQASRRIRLPALLALAGIAAPERRVTEFLVSIEQALADLARDGVIPGLRLARPEGWPEMLARRDARAVIAGSWVTFPPLAENGRHAAALPSGVENPAVGRRKRADETRQ